jgi:hypothetical protein
MLSREGKSQRGAHKPEYRRRETCLRGDGIANIPTGGIPLLQRWEDVKPGGAEGFFREVGQPTDDRSLPDPVEPTEELLQSLFATGERYGFGFLGPLPERAE